MTIIVDSDGFIGSLNPDDLHYPAAQKILSELIKQKAILIYPVTTLVEAITFLQGRLNNSELASQVLQSINDNQLIVESVDQQTLLVASLLMDFKKSKHNTLFDAIVAAIAQRYKADAIFSFDKFYKSRGFKLASEL